MLLVVYDIQSDKIRTRFAKYLEKYGVRVQYSVFEIRHSKRFLENIQSEMRNYYEKQFTEDDSVLVFQVPDHSNILKFGYPKNEDTDLLIL